MLTIEELNGHNRGKRAERRLRVSGIADDAMRPGKPARNFHFILESNKIRVEPKSPDWYGIFTEEERLQVFNHILAEYRLRSVAQNGFQFAAIGITDAHEIYISINTEWVPHSYHRRCAEQNLVNIAFQDAAASKPRSEAAANGLKCDGPVVPQSAIRELYLMGGPTPGKAMCPCGDCTDLLARVMPKDGKIWALPVNDGTQELQINRDATMVSELLPNQVWQTTIGHLNIDRVIPLPATAAKLQRDAFHRVVQKISARLNDSNAGDDELADLPPIGKKVFESPDLLNQAMGKRIERLLMRRVDRLIGRYGIEDASENGVKEFILKHVEAVRCVALQLDGGAVVSHAASRDSSVSSEPHAEVIAKSLAHELIEEKGICNSAVMELNPKALEQGVMHTSPKEALERLGKAPSYDTGTIVHQFIPYNSEKLSASQVKAVSAERRQHEILPGGYVGGHGVVPATGPHTAALDEEVRQGRLRGI